MMPINRMNGDKQAMSACFFLGREWLLRLVACEGVGLRPVPEHFARLRDRNSHLIEVNRVLFFEDVAQAEDAKGIWHHGRSRLVHGKGSATGLSATDAEQAPGR
jgi:hypothetical protein